MNVFIYYDVMFLRGEIEEKGDREGIYRLVFIFPISFIYLTQSYETLY